MTVNQEEDPREALTRIVDDLRAEGAELHALLQDTDTGYWTTQTTFKTWTVWDVIAHLHFSDHMALTSLQSEEGFRAFLASLSQGSGGMRGTTERWLAEGGQTPGGQTPSGPELLARWYDTFSTLCDTLAAADPETRYAWVGPPMKARMFATARQMETWAHGWEIYDLMGLERTEKDRLRNIAEIGVRTFGWTFNNRKLPIPEPIPYVELRSPSGEVWQWHDPDSAASVRGDAVQFCQVVTQVRNVADTNLDVRGDAANAWMNIAQCFAGPPEEPPAPGSRG